MGKKGRSKAQRERERQRQLRDSGSTFTPFREEIFPLDLLRLLIQYLPILDIVAFNQAFQHNDFSRYLQVACAGLLVYDGQLKYAKDITWIVSSGLRFQELSHPTPTVPQRNQKFQEVAIYPHPDQLFQILIQQSQDTLTSIDFSSSRVHSEVIPDLLQCPKLTSVNFSDCSTTTSALASLFSSHPNLRSINISRLPVDDSLLQSVASLSQLRHLDISSNRWVNDGTIALIARECPRLQSIDISYTNIGGNIAVRELLLNCGELLSFQYWGISSLNDGTYMLIYATVCRRQLHSNDPRQNLIGAETFLDLVECGEERFIRLCAHFHRSL